MMDSASRCVWDLFGKDPDDTGCVIDVEAITLDKEKVTPRSPKILPKNGTATGVSGGTTKNIKIDTEENHNKTFGFVYFIFDCSLPGLKVCFLPISEA